MVKNLIKILLRENLQQADKMYFNTGRLSPEDKEIVLSITNGDNFTRLVSDWLYHITKFWKQDIGSQSNIKLLTSFYQNLKNYNKNILPLVDDLNSYSALTDERDKHVLDLYSCLENRNYALGNLNKLPSIAKRNLKDVIRKPESNEYAFKSLGEKFRDLNRSIESLPQNSNKYEQILNKIFNSKNSLDNMIETANHFATAFNVHGEETDKENVIEGLEYINADLIQDSGDILVIKVNDNEAMQQIGCTSTWCFSRPNSSQDWDVYAPYGFVYVIFNFSKDFEDATFLMTYLPDTATVYASTNVPLYELGIDDDNYYLKSIGVDLDKLDINFKEPESDPEPEEYEDSKQLSLFEGKKLIKNLLRENLNLVESNNNIYTMYHGTSHTITSFTDEFVGAEEAKDQQGPGIYFTSSPKNAMAYGNNIYKVELSPKKSVSTQENKNAPLKEIEWLMKNAPNWKETAQNWNENPLIGYKIAAKDFIQYNENPHQQFLQVWIDFYRNNPVEYLRNMVKLGYDSVIIGDLNSILADEKNITHIIVLNPSIIKFLGVESN